jgi:hypothetical protein
MATQDPGVMPAAGMLDAVSPLLAATDQMAAQSFQEAVCGKEPCEHKSTWWMGYSQVGITIHE